MPTCKMLCGGKLTLHPIPTIKHGGGSHMMFNLFKAAKGL